ncbi:MAG: extracellular solute-binding protein [Chloroflexota bacterium]|jgi:arabinogalactan oligomer/maltooligosaccharide transport system substrate-binding protein|nr:extracellular solute-binding protein [Chloroflexota bacterium]
MKKQIRLAALVAGVAIIAAACSDGGASTAPSTAPESTAPSAAPESMAPESQAPAALVGEVTFWHTYSSGAGTELEAITQVLDAVKAANPDLVVNVLEVPFADVYNKWNADVATGAATPTLFIAPNDSLGFQAREGVLADVDMYLGDKMGDTVQVAIDGSKVDGKFYMVPESLKAVAMTYDTAKIATPPATTDALLAGVKDGSINAGFYGGTAAYHNFGWWAAFGGQLMDDTGKCIADTTGVGDAYAYLAELQAAGATFYPNYDDMANAFKAGDIDLIVDGPWATGGYKEAVPTVGVAPMPAGPVGPSQPLTGVDGWYINPNTPDVQLAVDFALAMTTQAAQQIMVDVSGHIPANKNIAITDPITQGFADAVATGYPRPQVPQLDNFWGNFGNALQLVLESGADPQQAVADACAAMNEANGL